MLQPIVNPLLEPSPAPAPALAPEPTTLFLHELQNRYGNESDVDELHALLLKWNLGELFGFFTR